MYLTHFDLFSASALLAIAALLLLPVCICNQVDLYLHVTDCHLAKHLLLNELMPKGVVFSVHFLFFADCSEGVFAAQVTPKPATSFDANILSVAPTAPRFSYLPISTPSLTSSALRNHPASTASPMAAGMGLVPTGPAALARPSDMLDQTGDYSFANINVGRAVSAVSAEQQRAVESASGTTLEVSLLVAPLSCDVMLLLKRTCAELSCVVVNMSSSSCCMPASLHASIVTIMSTSTRARQSLCKLNFCGAESAEQVLCWDNRHQPAPGCFWVAAG